MLFIVRINYRQNLDIDHLVGAIFLCGIGGEIWLVEGGNWKMDGSLNGREIEVSLHLHKNFLQFH